MWEKPSRLRTRNVPLWNLVELEPEEKKGLWNSIKRKISPYEKIWKEGVETPPEESESFFVKIFLRTTAQIS